LALLAVIGFACVAALDAHLLWTTAVVLILAVLPSPLFLVLTSRAYGRMSPDGIALTPWRARSATFRRLFVSALLPAGCYAGLLAVLTVLFGLAFGEWEIPAAVSPAAMALFAAAQFWLAWQLARWERRHGFALYREVGTRFGRATERLVRTTARTD
jgi:hypothetical protein